MRSGFLSNLAREIFAVAFRIAVYFGLLAGVGVFAIKLVPITAGIAGTDAPISPWIELKQSSAAFSASFPDIDDKDPAEVVLRHAAGGGRRDQLLFERNGRSALIEIYRAGRERDDLSDARAVIVERVGTAGAVDAFNSAPAIESRFGPVSLYDFMLVQGEWRRGCLGFIRDIPEPRVQISGWFCNPDPGMVARPRVACAIDRLTLLTAGADPNIARFFAQADLKSGACATKLGRARVNMAMADWIDARRDPRLRGIVRR